MSLYQLLDKLFIIFHIALITFNVFGWIPRKLRKWNLLTLSLTAFSWIVLGFFYGFGYCFLTDWHWTIREKLGYSVSSDSYIHFLVTELTSLSVQENVVDTVTGIVFVLAFAISVFVNLRDRRKRRVRRSSP